MAKASPLNPFTPSVVSTIFQEYSSVGEKPASGPPSPDAVSERIFTRKGFSGVAESPSTPSIEIRSQPIPGPELGSRIPISQAPPDSQL